MPRLVLPIYLACFALLSYSLP